MIRKTAIKPPGPFMSHADLAKTIDDAFEKRNEISPATNPWWVFNPTLANYVEILTSNQFLRFFFNSAMVSIFVVTITMLITLTLALPVRRVDHALRAVRAVVADEDLLHHGRRLRLRFVRRGRHASCRLAMPA